MAGSQPIIDNIVDMEKTDPGILTRLLDKISEIDDNYSERIGNMYKPLLEDNGSSPDCCASAGPPKLLTISETPRPARATPAAGIAYLDTADIAGIPYSIAGTTTFSAIS